MTRAASLLLSSLVWPAVAFAHTRGGEVFGFVSFEHPISGLDHVVAMIAVGLWGAQLGAPAVWLLPVTFPMVMAFGGMLGLMGVALPGIEVGIAISAIALGFVVCCEARPPLWIAACVVGVFAIFHGNAHGTELPPGANGLLYSIGFVIATGTLHATGIGIGVAHGWPAGRVNRAPSGPGMRAVKIPYQDTRTPLASIEYRYDVSRPACHEGRANHLGLFGDL
jgi:urease accessory protein